jgi:UDP-galactopyranose mutase
MPPSSIVVYSHLRWDFVYQRPQHVLSRLARRHPVLFVEEAIADPGQPAYLDVECVQPGVTRCRPHLPTVPEAFPTTLEPLLRAQLRSSDGPHVAWLYSPMALPVARTLSPSIIAYDCMDELSAFHGAPAALRTRERALLTAADVVFTGGPSLYRAKRERNPRVLCLPSSVDVAHFQRATTALPEPADQAALAHPRLGFFGVLDERLDTALLGAVADARPGWQFVLVGPVVKIDPAVLPRRPNLHYLGQRAYADLPAYLAGWDVCLLPFARNEATRFISPTKTLEYMAAERPIVSTSIVDVAEPYAGVVSLADTPGDFVAACEHALTSPLGDRLQAMRRIVAGTSWDSTVAAMETALDEALRAAAARERAA